MPSGPLERAFEHAVLNGRDELAERILRVLEARSGLVAAPQAIARRRTK